MLAFPLFDCHTSYFSNCSTAYFKDVSKICVKNNSKMQRFGLCGMIDHAYVFMKPVANVAVTNDAHGSSRKAAYAARATIKTGHRRVKSLGFDCVEFSPFNEEAKAGEKTGIVGIEAVCCARMHVSVAARNGEYRARANNDLIDNQQPTRRILIRIRYVKS